MMRFRAERNEEKNRVKKESRSLFFKGKAVSDFFYTERFRFTESEKRYPGQIACGSCQPKRRGRTISTTARSSPSTVRILIRVLVLV